MKECTIIIPNYNGVRFLEKCLLSLQKQKGVSHEIILVDNASKDQSVDFVRNDFPEVQIIQLHQNYGFSYAVNKGINASKGKYIVLLNNDTEVVEDWLVSLYQQIIMDINIFSVSSKMIRSDQRCTLDDTGDELTILGWAFKRGDGSKETKLFDRSVFSSCAGAAIYRKEIFDIIGLFDELFFAYLEDVDIGYRARLFGFHNEYCAKALVYHIGSGTTGSKYNDFKIKATARNNIFLFYKNMPFLQLLINLPTLIIGVLIKYLFFLYKGFGNAYLTGLTEAFIQLKQVKRQKFSFKNSSCYLRIQWKLYYSTFIFFKNKFTSNSN